MVTIYLERQIKTNTFLKTTKMYHFLLNNSNSNSITKCSLQRMVMFPIVRQQRYAILWQNILFIDKLDNKVELSTMLTIIYFNPAVYKFNKKYVLNTSRLWSQNSLWRQFSFASSKSTLVQMGLSIANNF